ncbi:hypothetical protein STXM2123_3530 [Streptomyces sp. F-3]|nr:hypothetical protein STXM2123_3530 [Streptomyces sp. F-3]
MSTGRHAAHHERDRMPCPNVFTAAPNRPAMAPGTDRDLCECDTGRLRH